MNTKYKDTQVELCRMSRFRDGDYSKIGLVCDKISLVDFNDIS